MVGSGKEGERLGRTRREGAEEEERGYRGREGGRER